MIKNILWDFDGVIVDSMKIKGDGFVELFSSYEKDDVSKLEEFHYANGGASRFEKIRYFFNDILKKDILNVEIDKLATKFSKIIEKKLRSKDNLIEDTLNFIEKNYTKYNFHIVSAAEHNELNSLCEFLQINRYFITIEGSPTKKDILIRNILEKYSYVKESTILIGDSINDYSSAKKNSIEFYGYNNLTLAKYGNYINLFKEVKF